MHTAWRLVAIFLIALLPPKIKLLNRRGKGFGGSALSRLHYLGPSPLFHFLAEIDRGASVQDTLETYGRLPVAFVRAIGGDRFAPLVHLIDGE